MEIILGACNNNCEFCRLEKTVGIDAAIAQAKEKLVIKGGDPGLCNEVFGIIKKAKQKGLQVILETSGRSLYYSAIATKLVDSGVDMFKIYFFGDEAAHDNITQAKGSYAQTMKGIMNLASKTKNLDVELRMVGRQRPNLDFYRSHFRNLAINFSATRMHYSALSRSVFEELKGSLHLPPEKFLAKFIDMVPASGIELLFFSSLKEALQQDLARLAQIRDDLPVQLKSYFYTMPFSLPDRISIATSASCNLHCRDCSSWKYRRTGAMSAEDHLSIIEKIHDWNPGAEIVFCGPEPLNNPKALIPALKKASQLGLRTGVITNGMLVNDMLAEGIMECRPSYVVVSLDGSTAKTHDYVKDCQGSFEKAVNAIKLFIKHKNRTSVSASAVITDRNISELVPMAQMLEDMGADGVDFNPYLLSNSFQGHVNYNDDLWVKSHNLQMLKDAVEELIARKQVSKIDIVRSDRRLRLAADYFAQQGKFRKEHAGFCLSGYTYFNIDCTGQVSVCEKGPNIDVRDWKLDELWNSYEFWLARLNARACQEGCIDGCYDKIGHDTLELL